MPDVIDSVSASQAIENTIGRSSDPQGSWVRWSPVWRAVDGHGELVLSARYGGPLTSYLTEAGRMLSKTGRLDPSGI